MSNGQGAYTAGSQSFTGRQGKVERVGHIDVTSTDTPKRVLNASVCRIDVHAEKPLKEPHSIGMGRPSQEEANDGVAKLESKACRRMVRRASSAGLHF